jgi:beta-galactosidase
MSNPPFRFGVDYYPEHWPEERWPEDARLMAEAGFNVVRLAEFAWSRMEPQDGKFDFDWLDRVLEILRSRGISAVLGTPTASPPPWLMTKNPDIFRLHKDGKRATYGNRCEYCPNHPDYHEYARRIVSAMAEHYSNHPAVIGWQIDNEMGGRCYCPVCQGKFQRWLKVHYGTLEKMNAAWGTDFWSHVYNDWSEVPVPLATSGSPNPGLALDFDRFASDSFVAYQQMQVDILRKICSGHFITHNFMGFGYEELDYYDLARTLDLVAWDNYPCGFWLTERPDPLDPALNADAMRGLKQKNVWVMEQQAGASGWEVVSPAPRPGELRLWAYQSIAHGADGIVFFRWRTARHGTEQYWHGLLDHDARPGRRYEEIKGMGAELRRIGDQILGAAVKPQVALLNSYDSRFGFRIQPNNPQFHYGRHFRQIYRAFYQKNTPVDIVAPTADLSVYKLVVVPAMYILKEDVAANLRHFVGAGGTLVVTPRTGVKDEANAVVNLPLPGLLADLCGVIVEDYDALSQDIPQSVEFLVPELAGLKPLKAGLWCDILAPQKAEVIACYTQDYYAGKAAITLNRVGKGKAVYVGTFGETSLYSALFDWLLGDLRISAILDVPKGVEVTKRWQGERRMLFLLNHNALPQTLTLPRRYVNLLAAPAVLEGTITLAPHGVLVLSEEKLWS